MDQLSLEAKLKNLPLGSIRYFKQIGSTNDLAAAWAAQGVSDLSLVIADEQISGRGRGQRKWFTPPRSALAFSLILSPAALNGAFLTHQNTARLNGLGALAVQDAIKKQFDLPAQIKWPNDVLINGKKTAGILTESKWAGNRLAHVILGIGVNISPASVPPEEQLNFPATCIETEIGKTVNRLDFLYVVLEVLLDWCAKLNTAEFITAWEENLALKSQKVQVFSDSGNPQEGLIEGLNPDGSLRLRIESGEIIDLQIGEIPPVNKIRLRSN